ncbi:MAG: hypothetical protein JW809_16070 [Pirellulales bacterium]|nr:hypothetical protein [Pirellulales bacterium]
MANAATSGVLDREFLPLRARLIDLAAALDRIDRASGLPAADPRREQIAHGLAVLNSPEPNRAEAVLAAFSLPYDPEWRAKTPRG